MICKVSSYVALMTKRRYHSTRGPATATGSVTSTLLLARSAQAS
ncbi:hypothetical protein AKJ09_08889 [Labilithrix luteola]|uniref:Uncharacterized protein n=1 Tax=Labilithrix luteola TaxID=1391654 RepID=A0A0K1Q8X5_9BACT|nr:hypothetical protein AKJ09_08889 [Labilithrix luteola]